MYVYLDTTEMFYLDFLLIYKTLEEEQIEGYEKFKDSPLCKETLRDILQLYIKHHFGKKSTVRLLKTGYSFSIATENIQKMINFLNHLEEVKKQKPIPVKISSWVNKLSVIRTPKRTWKEKSLYFSITNIFKENTFNGVEFKLQFYFKKDTTIYEEFMQIIRYVKTIDKMVKELDYYKEELNAYIEGRLPKHKIVNKTSNTENNENIKTKRKQNRKKILENQISIFTFER